MCQPCGDIRVQGACLLGTANHDKLTNHVSKGSLMRLVSQQRTVIRVVGTYRWTTDTPTTIVYHHVAS